MSLKEPDTNAYGLWPLVIMNSLVFIIFAFSFTKPCHARISMGIDVLKGHQ